MKFLYIWLIYVNVFHTYLICAYSLKKNLSYSPWHSIDLYLYYEFEQTMYYQCFSKLDGPAFAQGNWRIPDVLFLLRFTKEDSKNFLSPEERYFKLLKMNKMPLTTTKFFLEFYDDDHLIISMKALRESLFWNHYGFFLVKKTNTNGSCQYSYSTLKVFWDFHILNVIYMCYHSDYGITLYTFNPFNEIAPSDWKIASQHLQENGHPLRVFRLLLNYTEVDFASICEGLTYDKTRNLSSYPIKVINTIVTGRSVMSEKLNILQNSIDLAHIIWEKLGPNLKVKNISVHEFGHVESNCSFSGALRDIFKGTSQNRNNLGYQKVWQYEAYVQNVDGLCYVIRKRRITILAQLFTIFASKANLLFILIFVLIIIFFSQTLNASFLQIGLEILRVLTGASTILQPTGSRKNFMFILLIFSLMSLTLYLQSQLYALITTTKTQSVNIKSYNDIDHGSYQVYSIPYFTNYFKETPLFKQIIKDSSISDCLKRMESNVNVVCIYSCTEAKYFVTENNDIEILPDVILRKYLVYFFREDSPVCKRFQWYLHLLAQNGLLKYHFYIKRSYYFLPPHVNKYQNITVFDLQNIFYLGLIMLLLSTIVFAFEITNKFF